MYIEDMGILIIILVILGFIQNVKTGYNKGYAPKPANRAVGQVALWPILIFTLFATYVLPLVIFIWVIKSIWMAV